MYRKLCVSGILSGRAVGEHGVGHERDAKADGRTQFGGQGLVVRINNTKQVV